jgi:hypothetical protein
MVGAKIKIKSPFEKYAMCSQGTEGWRQWPEREGNDCLGSDSLVLLAVTEFSFMKDIDIHFNKHSAQTKLFTTDYISQEKSTGQTRHE